MCIRDRDRRMEETATAVTSQKSQIPQKETAENTQRSLVLECACLLYTSRCV